MRVLLQLLMALSFVAAGVLVGAFNPQDVTLDFHVAQVHAHLGVAVLASVFVGALLGGLAIGVSVVLPLQARLRKARREAASAAATARAPTSA